jgi:signal transduction histidine kinase
MKNPENPTPQSPEILIAEDSPTQAQRLRYILEQQGYRVTAAVNGRLALEAAQQRKPALILSDIVMPEMDGYELSRRVKSDPNLADVPVILVTSLSDPHDVIRGLECRADNFILKPYDERYLLSRLRFVLVNREMRQSDQPGMGLEIFFNGQRHFITADRLQILNLLLSTYEAAIQRNKELENVNKELAAANKELEAFTYSVSHDLRSPVRHINGFCKLLLDDHAGTLPPASKHLLDHVSKAGKRLSELIDDLLNLSRLSRQPLARQTVSLANLVRDVLEELRPEQEGRQIDLRIGTLPDCAGDFSLLKQVFINLLSNALKFTRQRAPAVIEVGCQEDDEELTCFVRDNGAGFNMAHAERLFGVFQRLHSADDFEGTGIGLSIVQRIIAKHGGQVWAEAEEDRGATFFFTLPISPVLATNPFPIEKLTRST